MVSQFRCYVVQFLKRPVRRKISTCSRFCFLQKYKLKKNQNHHETKRESVSPKLSKLILCCCEPIFSIGNVIKGLPKEVLFFIQVLHELFSEWMIKGILCKIWCGHCQLKASLDMNVKRDHHNIFKFFSAFVLTSHECTSQYCFGLVFRV